MHTHVYYMCTQRRVPLLPAPEPAGSPDARGGRALLQGSEIYIIIIITIDIMIIKVLLLLLIIIITTI